MPSSRPYKLNDEMRYHVDKQLDELLMAKVITEDNGSAFASPIVMVKKRDRNWRFCVDMRKLYAISVPLYHELPVLKNIIDVVNRNKARVMTTLDLCSAYHQLPLTEECSHKTTFVTPHRGCYRYLRFPKNIRKVPSL